MNRLFCLLAFIFLSACNTKGTISYAHDARLSCPAPIPISDVVAAELDKYVGDGMMQAFHRHYLQQQKELALSQAGQSKCPSAFWAPQEVGAKFRQYPSGHPMREFFKAYVEQQRTIDAYYAPAMTGVK